MNNLLTPSKNPNQQPVLSGPDPSVRGIRLGHVGLAFSLLGVLGVFLASIPSICAWLAILNAPGFLISLVGLRRPPRKLAAWGAALGFIGLLYVPTIFRPMVTAVSGDAVADPFPPLPNARIDSIWQRPAEAKLAELISATMTTGKARDWERAVYFLWCTEVRLQFEEAVFPPKQKGGSSPLLAYIAIAQMLEEGCVPMLSTDPDAHKRAITHFRSYVPDLESGYQPQWDYGPGISKAEAQVQAKKAVAAIADSAARILDLTAVPEYLASLKVYVNWADESSERGERFHAANATMWRIEQEKKIKSGLAFPPHDTK